MAIGDLERPDTLTGAFSGVDALWLLTAAGPQAPHASSNAVWAARNARVSHIVRLSALGTPITAREIPADAAYLTAPGTTPGSQAEPR